MVYCNIGASKATCNRVYVESLTERGLIAPDDVGQDCVRTSMDKAKGFARGEPKVSFRVRQGAATGKSFRAQELFNRTNERAGA
jgi:hypothetical protein